MKPVLAFYSLPVGTGRVCRLRFILKENLCVLNYSHNKQHLFHYTAFHGRLFFIMEAHCILREVRTAYLCLIYVVY
jgi:hypothetical protein